MLDNLKIFNVSENRLGDSIESELFPLSSLKYVDLSFNLRFAGTIPESLYSTTTLQDVLLSEHVFTGIISTKIGKLRNLRDLEIDRKRFIGVIPTEEFQVKHFLQVADQFIFSW